MHSLNATTVALLRREETSLESEAISLPTLLLRILRGSNTIYIRRSQYDYFLSHMLLAKSGEYSPLFRRSPGQVTLFEGDVSPALQSALKLLILCGS